MKPPHIPYYDPRDPECSEGYDPSPIGTGIWRSATGSMRTGNAMNKMEWRTISICPKYEASEDGEIRNATTKRTVKPYTDPKQEYPRITCYDENGRKRKIMVHTLVAAAFLGPKPEGMEIDHINTNRFDCSAKNLRYVTPEENRNNPVTLLKRKMRKMGTPMLF